MSHNSSQTVDYNDMTILGLLFSGQADETIYEEIANGLTHLIGIIGSLIGMYILTLVAIFHRKSTEHIIGCIVYGLSLLILYTFSTTYHAVGIFYHQDHEMKETFRTLDHVAIYFMIAGTYTPMVLFNLIKKKQHVTLGYLILGSVWLCAVLGIFFKVVIGTRYIPPYVSNSFYLFMGWIGVFAAKPMINAFKGTLTWRWLVASGIAYSTGVWFLTWDALHFNHAVWHLHVLAGGFTGYIAVLLSAIPANSADAGKNSTQVIYDFFTVQLRQKAVNVYHQAIDDIAELSEQTNKFQTKLRSRKAQQ